MTDLFRRMRDMGSKWLMRTREAGSVLRLVFFGQMALNTTVLAIRDTFLEQYQYHVIGFFVIGVIGFIWFYDWSRTMKRQQQFTTYRKQNFLNPENMMEQRIRARQLAEMAKWIKEDNPEMSAEERMDEATVEMLKKWRNGMPLEDVMEDN